MKKKIFPIVTVKLDKIVGGGRAIGNLENGCKIFVWGGLPGETVNVQITKKKSKLAEGVVTEVLTPSNERISPRDETSYLSTSPWQIMNFDAEQRYKSALIKEAYELHNIVLPDLLDLRKIPASPNTPSPSITCFSSFDEPIGSPLSDKTASGSVLNVSGRCEVLRESSIIEIYSDNKQYEYRNKIEFSWWWDKITEQLDLAFFQRGTHGKIPVDGTSLAHPSINRAATAIRDLLRETPDIRGFNLKTLLVRCDKNNNVVAQLYVKNPDFTPFSDEQIKKLEISGFELIFSNPKSPASVITKRLQSWGITHLTDTILDIPFNYAVEGFFQINIPVYEQALRDMKQWVSADKPTVDLYSGVGTIGLTIGGPNITLVEINEPAVIEMKRNIKMLDREKTVRAILAPSEKVLDNITANSTIIVDPPRAGLHSDVVSKLLETTPERIIYLSCNPVTQARDVALLAEKYEVLYHRGYNFFPRTPHIEHLVILDLKTEIKR